MGPVQDQQQEAQPRQDHGEQARRPRQPSGSAKTRPPDPSTPLSCPLCHNVTLQQHRLPSVTTAVTGHSAEKNPKKQLAYNPLSNSTRLHRWTSATSTFGSLPAVAETCSLGCVAFRTHTSMCAPPETRCSGILFPRGDAGAISTARIRSWARSPRPTRYSVRQGGCR